MITQFLRMITKFLRIMMNFLRMFKLLVRDLKVTQNNIIGQSWEKDGIPCSSWTTNVMSLYSVGIGSVVAFSAFFLLTWSLARMRVPLSDHITWIWEMRHCHNLISSNVTISKLMDLLATRWNLLLFMWEREYIQTVLQLLMGSYSLGRSSIRKYVPLNRLSIKGNHTGLQLLTVKDFPGFTSQQRIQMSLAYHQFQLNRHI